MSRSHEQGGKRDLAKNIPYRSSSSISYKPRDLRNPSFPSTNNLSKRLEPKADSIDMMNPQRKTNDIRPKSKKSIKIILQPINFFSHDEDYPDTVSPYWILIDDMKKIAPFNNEFKENVDRLNNEGFVGWKKSRGDGNCYYRAVMHNFFRLLFKVKQDTTRIQKFMQTVQQLNH